MYQRNMHCGLARPPAHDQPDTSHLTAQSGLKCHIYPVEFVRKLADSRLQDINQTLVPHVDKQSSTERGGSGYSNEVPASDLQGARVWGNVATRPDRPPGCERDGWPANTLARFSPE